MALRLCGNALDYAKALVQMEEASGHHPRMAMALARKGERRLLQRIRRILNQPQNKVMMIEKFTATGLLLTALLFFSASSAEDSRPFAASIGQEQSALAAPWKADTFPDGSIHIQTERDGQSIAAKLEGGAIVQLKIDGRSIPASAFQNYKPLIEEILADMPAPPAPPVPPAPPAPPVPSAPPTPPAPPAPKASDQNGSVQLIQHEDGSTSTIVKVDDRAKCIVVLRDKTGKKQVIVSGRAIETNDSIIVWDGPVEVAYPDSLPKPLEDEVLQLRLEKAGEQARLALRELDLDKELLKIEIEKEVRQVLEEAEIEKAAVEGELRRAMEEVEFTKEGMREEVEREVRRALEIAAREQEAVKLEQEKVRAGKAAIEQQLVKDGLIDKSEGYTLKLSSGVLRVNGKTLPKEAYERYKRLIEQSTGTPLTEDDVVEIKK
jgi:hypothetical protein